MKKNLMKLAAVLLSLTLLLATLAGCGGPSSQGGESTPPNSQNSQSGGGTGDQGGNKGEPASGQVDHVVMALRGTTFDPAPFTPSNPGMFIKTMLYATPIYRPYYGAPLEDCKMWLAKSVEKTADKTYTIVLYDNIVDSKGNTINADDVIWSYETSRTVAQFVDASAIKSLTKIDDVTLEMVLVSDAPGEIESMLSNSNLYIVDQGWYESATEEELRTDAAVTGTYRPTAYVPGSSLTLEALDEYWQTDPELLPEPAYRNVKTVDFKVITEASMRAIALENGEIDISEISTPDVKRFYDAESGTSREGWLFDHSPETVLMAAFLNMDSGKSPLADNINLRKAVLYALNSEDLMYGGGYEDSTATVLKAYGFAAAEGSLKEWDDPNYEYLEFDLDTAREYYKASGYKEGEVTLRVMTSMSLVNDGFRSVLFANLEAVGFKVDSLAVDQALFNTYKNDSSQWDVMLDLKTSLTGHIAGLWTYCFDPAAFENGSVCFTHDDKLTELLYATAEKGDEASVRAFSDYLTDQAICKGLYGYGYLFVAQDGILEMTGIDIMNYVLPQALVYSSDYKSVAD